VNTIQFTASSHWLSQETTPSNGRPFEPGQ